MTKPLNLSTTTVHAIMHHLNAAENFAQFASEASVDCEAPAEPHATHQAFEQNMRSLFASARRACDVWNKATGRKVL